MTCSQCGAADHDPWSFPRHQYSYLLGQYLGDGCISPAPRGVWKLRIFCADAYPSIMSAVETAMRAVLPRNSVGRVQKIGCTEIWSYSKQWACLFPQHGPGRKHERKIELEYWQREIVDMHREEFVRGLIHSDGSRYVNTVRVKGKAYAYPRYEFVNLSTDITRLCSAPTSSTSWASSGA